MKIPFGVLEEHDIADALDEEIESPPQLIPEDGLYPALTGHRIEGIDWIYNQLMASAFVPSPEETVGASKAGHGIRPIAVWDLPSRIGYRALVRQIERHVPALPRSRTHHEEFQRMPLDDPGKYIVAADIAACYQNLDHGLLLEEAEIQTGERAAISAIRSLLIETTGRSYGIPQQSHASDVLAEVFLARLERSLLRRGLVTHRYNDDFRFACSSWSEVIRTLEVLEEETRKVGLTVNDLKTVTWRRSNYSDHLDDSTSLRQEIADEAELDLTTYDEDDYGGSTVTEPSAEEVDVHMAARVLDRWAEVAGRGRVANRNRMRHRAVIQLIPYALSTLAEQSVTSSEVLARCVQLLRYERTMTPAVANYLLTRSDQAQVISAVDKLLSSRAYLNGWQIWWLQRPVARLSAFAVGPGAKRRLSWAQRAFQTAEYTPVLRAEAACTLATHHQITVDELFRIYDRSSDVVRPTIAAAIALLKPPARQRDSIAGESALNRIAYDWAAMFA